MHPDDGSVRRREFLGSAALTTAGAALGLSAWMSDPKRDVAAQEERSREFHKDKSNLVRMGFIGVGNRGSTLLETALQVPGAIPMAVADVQADKRNSNAEKIRETMAKKLGDKSFEVATYEDYRDLLANPEIEAVFIASPHYLHGPMAIDAIEAGKHVYCEKALAFTIGENWDIYNLVASGRKAKDGSALVFQVGHQRHYSPLYKKVKELCDGDRIGDLAGFRAQWNQNDEVRRPTPNPELEKVVNWRLYSEMSGGLTTEFATHQIDVVNWLLGTHPDSVCGYGGVDFYPDGRDTDDNIYLVYNYKVRIPARDAYGRIRRDAKGETIWELDANGQPRVRNVRFQYMSIMANAHLGPSELIMGRYGTIGISLGGGEFWKEKKARQDPNRIAEGTNPLRSKQKDILRSGPTVATGFGGPPGDPIEGDEFLITHEDGTTERDRRHWTRYIDAITTAYDKVETLLAIESFTDCVRNSRAGKPFKVSADAEIGMWSAVAALMANIAMREQRTVYWEEFIPKKAV
ncbi:MAG TPA: Gfo/Idh/MocA family oxidoreductase [Planctomycetota bacterium]|nr:Gfo/Idh/MocA family oxidoreductase [Planctomycetota bacterium]